MQYIGGRLGIPGLGGIMTGSPAYQGQIAAEKKRVDLQFLPQEEAIRNLSKYLSPEANVELQRALATVKSQAEYPQQIGLANQNAINTQETNRLQQERAAQTELTTLPVEYPDGRRQEITVTRAQAAAVRNGTLPLSALLPGAPGPAAGPGPLGPTPQAAPPAGQSLPPAEAGAGPAPAPNAQGAPGAPLIGKTVPTEFETQLTAPAAKAFQARSDAAQKTATSLDATREAKRLVDSGIYTGKLADLKFQLAKLFGTEGGNARDTVARTEQYLISRAATVRDMIGVLGSANAVSNLDLEFTREAAGGTKTLDEPTIRRILLLEERYGRKAIERFNRDAAKVEARTNLPYPLQIEMPPYIHRPEEVNADVLPPASEGRTPGTAAPAAGTVQDGYQFLGGDPANPKSWRKVQ